MGRVCWLQLYAQGSCSCTSLCWWFCWGETELLTTCESKCSCPHPKWEPLCDDPSGSGQSSDRGSFPRTVCNEKIECQCWSRWWVSAPTWPETCSPPPSASWQSPTAPRTRSARPRQTLLALWRSPGARWAAPGPASPWRWRTRGRWSRWCILARVRRHWRARKGTETET